MYEVLSSYFTEKEILQQGCGVGGKMSDSNSDFSKLSDSLT